MSYSVWYHLTILKAKCSPFETCIVCNTSMSLYKVTKPFAEFTVERPSYNYCKSVVFLVFFFFQILLCSSNESN